MRRLHYGIMAAAEHHGITKAVIWRNSEHVFEEHQHSVCGGIVTDDAGQLGRAKADPYTAASTHYLPYVACHQIKFDRSLATQCVKVQDGGRASHCGSTDSMHQAAKWIEVLLKEMEDTMAEGARTISSVGETRWNSTQLALQRSFAPDCMHAG
jgi:hypothetical protein